MPPAKRAPAKAPEPEVLDRELDDDTPDEPEAIEPEAIEPEPEAEPEDLRGPPAARIAIGYYPAAQRHNDIRRPAQALAAAASRAEDHVTAGVEGAADLIVVAVEPGQGDTVKAWLELALGLAEPAVQD